MSGGDQRRRDTMPSAPPERLDDIVLADDAPAPAAAPRPSAEPPRRRGRMTLRIPDDEISRPNIADLDDESEPRVEAAHLAEPPRDAVLPPLAPLPIVSVGGPPAGGDADDTLELPPLVDVEATLLPRFDRAYEDSWTPFQPSVAPSFDSYDRTAQDRPTDPDAAPARARSQAPAPAAPAPDSVPISVETPSDDEIPVDFSATSGELGAASDPEELSADELHDEEGDRDGLLDGEDVIVDSEPPAPEAAAAAVPAKHREPPVGLVSTPSLASAAAAPAAAPPAAAPSGVSASAAAAAAATDAAKKRAWWEDFFGDDFVRTMERMSPRQIAREADFIEESLGCERGATLLDLACGTGRHAIELASRGYKVVGLDLSLSMLARASDEAQDRRQRLNFVQGDMRELAFEEMFDGIYCWDTSFGFFDEERNAAVVQRVHRALKKGGQFLLDMANRDFLMRHTPSLAWFEGDGCVCMDDVTVDVITSRLKVKRTLMLEDGRTREVDYSIRLYAVHELGKVLHDAGFRVCEVSGRVATPGVHFGADSPRTIILAEKR